jgi:hypothetical protein
MLSAYLAAKLEENGPLKQGPSWSKRPRFVHDCKDLNRSDPNLSWRFEFCPKKIRFCLNFAVSVGAGKMIYQTKSTEFWGVFPSFWKKLNFGKKLSWNSNFGPNPVRFRYKIQILDKSSQISIQNSNFVSLFLSKIWPKNTKISEFCLSRTGPINFPKRNPNHFVMDMCIRWSYQAFGLIWSNMFKLCLMYV